MAANGWNTLRIKKIKEIGVKSLNITGQVVLNQNIINVTPLKEGKLRLSLVVDNATMNSPTMSIRSKGNIAPYNVVRHEIRAQNYTTQGTEYKFIENPFRNKAQKTFAKVYRGELRKNGY